MVALVLISIGFFFYGLIKNIQAQQERQIAIESTKRQMACEKHFIELPQQLQGKEQQLQLALVETLVAKDHATRQAAKAEKSRAKISK